MFQSCSIFNKVLSQGTPQTVNTLMCLENLHKRGQNFRCGPNSVIRSAICSRCLHGNLQNVLWEMLLCHIGSQTRELWLLEGTLQSWCSGGLPMLVMMNKPRSLSDPWAHCSTRPSGLHPNHPLLKLLTLSCPFYHLPLHPLLLQPPFFSCVKIRTSTLAAYLNNRGNFKTKDVLAPPHAH